MCGLPHRQAVVFAEAETNQVATFVLPRFPSALMLIPRDCDRVRAGFPTRVMHLSYVLVLHVTGLVRVIPNRTHFLAQFFVREQPSWVEGAHHEKEFCGYYS